jgi:hypothetical protein
VTRTLPPPDKPTAQQRLMAELAEMARDEPPAPEEIEGAAADVVLDEELTLRELLFVQHYTGQLRTTGNDAQVRPWNATAAALAAGWPESYAHVAGCKLLKRAKVRELVDEEKRAAVAAARITSRRTAEHYAAMAYADSAAYFHPDGRVKLPGELTREQALAVSSIEVDERAEYGDGTETVHRKFKYRLHDKLRALEFCRAMLDMAPGDLTIRHVHTGPGGGAVEVANLTAEEAARLYAERVSGSGRGGGAAGG